MNLRNRREKLIYFASMIDGEGSIGIEHLSPCKARKKSYYTCRLCVINTSKKLINWIHTNFGGSINMRPKKDNCKLCYRWHIFGKNLENLLNELLPFLFLKHRQAEIVLEYRKTVGKTGWNLDDATLEIRKKLWLQCKKLNQLGDQ